MADRTDKQLGADVQEAADALNNAIRAAAEAGLLVRIYSETVHRFVSEAYPHVTPKVSRPIVSHGEVL